MPVHNGAAFVSAAITSILQQTLVDFEFVIIDDGSKDESYNIISSFSDSRIRVIRNPSNLGLIATLNLGIREANGKYVARMDADDVALPERLKKQVERLESDTAVSVVSSYVEFINLDSEVTGVWDTDRAATTEEEIRSMMMRTNCIAHPTIMMRRDLALYFGYNSTQKGAEDWDLWMRMLTSGKRIVKLPEVLLHYRIHPGSITGKDKVAEVREVRLIRVKRKFLLNQLAKFRINGFYLGVMLSMMKNYVRHFVTNKFPVWARDVKRFMTSPPWKVIAQGAEFRKKLDAYKGRHYFVFPYLHVGGAEKVHAAIIESVKDQSPLVIFSGFSDTTAFLSRYTTNADVLDVAHYINYPLTRRRAMRLLADKVNASNNPVCLGSNAGLFYDLIPLLAAKVKVIDLIHAFKFQPGANLAHRKLLPLATRIDRRIFVSKAARMEFDKFSFVNNVPAAYRERLQLISNAVPVQDSPANISHDRVGILFVGRDSAEKRLELFLGIAKLLESNEPGKYRFTVVGNVQRRNDFDFVNFAGEISSDNELGRIYDEHDILILTSSREGFPVVIMEAMAHHLVVLATPVGDIPNRLNGKNGIVFSSADEKIVVSEAVREINRLVSAPGILLHLQDEAFNYAKENFGEQRFRGEYRMLLEA